MCRSWRPKPAARHSAASADAAACAASWDVSASCSWTVAFARRERSSSEEVPLPVARRGSRLLTLLTWIVFAVVAWEGRGNGAVLGPRGRGMLRTDGEDGATAGTGKAALGGPKVRTYLAGQLVGQRGPGTHRAAELGRCPQYHLGGYTQLAGQPVHIDHVCCTFSKVVASTVPECRRTQRPGVVRSSRSLPQFTIARAGNPVRGWLLSGVGRKARPTVRGRSAGPHRHALRGGSR
jgi:hypothetical protein